MDKIIASSSHRYRVFFSVLAALALLSVIFVSSSYRANAESAIPSANEHIITIHDDGVDKGFITKKSTLREAFAEQHIRVDAKDLIEPGIDSKLVASSYQVNIYRARLVAVRDGKVETKVITAYRTVGQIAGQAGVTLHNEDIAKLSPPADPIADGAAEIMTITRATPFSFNFYGKVEQAYTQGKTVGDMLKGKNITMGPKDGVSPAASTPITADMTVRIWRDGVQTVTQNEDMAFDTKTIQDADQPVGYKLVQVPGTNGQKTVTYEVNMQNGVEVSRKEINSVVVTQPVQQVVVVGAKNNYSGSMQDWLNGLRTCETHGNYQTNTGNGYYGAYQFSASTWNSLNTGYARADLAPAAVQDAAIIANTKRTAGLRTQNPGCYAKMGLSNYPPAA